MNIVKIKDDSLLISTGLSQTSFSKTNTAALISEKSTLFHIEGEKISCEPYLFDSTTSDEDGTAFFAGKAVKGEILSDILKKPEFSENDIFAISSYAKTVDVASELEDFSQTVGGGGIIIDADYKAQKADILFISPILFEECAVHHKADYSSLQGKFIYKGLDFPSSLYFTRGTVCYKALTGHYPFENADTTKRQEDIFDENFIPLNLWNSRTDEKLTETIEAALKLKLKQEILAGRRTLSDSQVERKRQKFLETAKRFDAGILKDSLTAMEHTYEDIHLSEKREQFAKKTQRILNAKRFLRRNKNRIFAGITAVFVAVWFVSGILRENAKLVTTRGMDSTKTTQALYTMIHRADVPNLQEILKGRNTKDIITKISGYYVSAKQRLEVSPDNGLLSPAKWFFYKKESKNWMYGITDLKIDGKSVAIEGKYAVKKEKPAKITEENGNILHKGDEVTHTAEYNFIHQAEAKFYIERMTDTVTLRWTGSQWKVVRIDGKSKIDSVKSRDFIDEYYSIKDGEVRAATDKLREKYDWIPGEEDFTDAAQFLSDEYGSIEAEKYLEK